MPDLQDNPGPKVAVVTGAAQGIGKRISLRLAKDGHKVVLNDLERQASLLEDVRVEIEKEGGSSFVQTGDVTIEEDVINLINKTVQQYGSLDIMVANAGALVTNFFIDSTPEELDKVFSVNVKGTFFCYKHAALQMIKQGRGGRIIGAASITGKQGLPKASLYSASKFAVRGMTQAAAGELGKHNITVNAYAPGPTDTDMLQELLQGMIRLDGVEPPPGPIKKKFGHLERNTQPDDIAGLVSFLASKDASMITGQSMSESTPTNAPLPVAIVTGAAQGIGRSISLRLAKDGYRVVLNDLERQAAQLEEVRVQIVEGGGQARIQFGDVTSETDVAKMIEDTVQEWKSLDVMVANAGICITKRFLESTVEDLNKIFSVNYTGTFLCYKYAALQMIKQGRGGRIIGAASLASKQGPSMLSLYGSTKFAIRGLTQAAAAELGQYNITVNAYAPGGVDTAMLKELLETRMKILGVELPKDSLLTTNLGVLGRDAVPEDIAGLVSFLVSKDANMITGQSVFLQMSSTSAPLPVAIVTGAAQGIGRTISLRLAKDGYRIVLSDLERQAAQLEAVRAQIVEGGGQARIQFTDVTSETDVAKMIDDTVHEWNSVDVMVANAGVIITKPFLESTIEDLNTIFSVNYTGVFLCYKYAALQMIKQGRGGRIVGAASLASKQGKNRPQSQYASSKNPPSSGQTVAAELGQYNITVNAYAPGGVGTAMLKRHLESKMRIQGDEPPQDTTLTTNLGFLGRDCVPEDIAGLVSFLVSKDANMITGQSMSQRVALVTGSAGGIGKAISLRLSNDGFAIALHDLPVRKADLEAVAAEIAAAGGKAQIFLADVVSEDEVEKMVNDVAEQMGSFDVMVANAGVAIMGPLVDSKSSDFSKTMDVNILGVFHCYKHAARKMIALKKEGRIIGASSVAGKQGLSLSSAYTASKFAVRGMTQTAALELARYNITVNAYAPGKSGPRQFILFTYLTDLSKDPEHAESLTIMQRQMTPPVKPDRGDPKYVADLVGFLASKEARWITGT
ncbi:hypothetical protein CVT24_003179 [Panaeolus cyanescens]|uniref:Diacetyl reductase [(S)-acetoin forming] n=1 Tax=Panaeolus cyanescens TaxID=181874 RepID=A0A409VUB6_9AGAR|nr:hypothetical protein CVT24_003179 [Panaeolus cyanescens]